MDFVQTMKGWRRMCETIQSENQKTSSGGWCKGCPVQGVCVIDTEIKDTTEKGLAMIGERIQSWAAEHPEPVYETWFEYLLRIGVIPENAPAGGEYQWIVESIKHKHISNDIAESLKLHPKEVQA